MDNVRIDSRYTTIIRDVYDNPEILVRINDNLRTNNMKIGRGVRLGDFISPKYLRWSWRMCSRNYHGKKGIKLYGSFLSHLRFADDIVLISTDPSELAEMVKEVQTSKKADPKINIQKSKIMSHGNIGVTIDNIQLENITHYIYLGHRKQNPKGRSDEKNSADLSLI